MPATPPTFRGPFRRLRVAIRGAVQGVGFRPFVFRLASELRLNGWVINNAQGVFIEVDGDEPVLREFLRRVEADRPAISFIQSLESSFLDAAGFTSFEIRESDGGEAKTAIVLPDLATCPDCLREIFDPGDRRYRYPFTNCTNCGPRFTIIESLPYDRPRTTMKRFTMCADCEREYRDPRDRRFHAQPNACPKCGPQLALWDSTGAQLASGGDALVQACAALREGRIVAVKGLGGFHLMCDARNADAIAEMRRRKRREEKPFALMYPDFMAAAAACEMSEVEARLLRAPESPIVLLRRRENNALPETIAPRNPWLGVMLPYTPLHHLLLRELGFPVVATSGNLSDEPICTREEEAVERLRGIADLFLVHDRPILRHVDDSIVREMGGRELVLRRARGFAPLPVQSAGNRVWIATGAHQKNAVAAAVGTQVFLSQHIGDLDTEPSLRAFSDTLASLQKLYDLAPPEVACDLHPAYNSTAWAERSGLRVEHVQHHYAHALACMAENALDAPVLAVTWDGSGYGPDGTVWGGEFLRITETGYDRLAHLRTFRLPGGEKAVKEPRRVALALLYEVFGESAFAMSHVPSVAAFEPSELKTLRSALARGINSPVTSSAGRLFDAVASLCGLRQRCAFEGQAAMELEFALHPAAEGNYELRLRDDGALDWEPMLRALLADMEAGLPVGAIARRFHEALGAAIAALAVRSGEEKVVLTGGCFQNRYLTECAIRHISAAGLRPYWHQRIPPNDGGIALGQIVAARRRHRGQ